VCVCVMMDDVSFVCDDGCVYFCIEGFGTDVRVCVCVFHCVCHYVFLVGLGWCWCS